MCGIIGYIGPGNVVPVLIDGLHRLEYRGYDSAGIALVEDAHLSVWKSVGRLDRLRTLLKEHPCHAHAGIGHTRWATHGEPNAINAHPHTDCQDQIAIVHNGIIENYLSLRTSLEHQGHSFRSETDSEVLAHLIETYYEGDLARALSLALDRVIGTYAIVALHSNEPDRLMAARRGSPLVVAQKGGECLVASDVSAMLAYTHQVTFLEDGYQALLTSDGMEIRGTDGRSAVPTVVDVSWDPDMIEKKDYRHFMQKEIFEQPIVLQDTLRGRLDLETCTVRLADLNGHWEWMRTAKRIILIACGTSWHAALIGEYLLEMLARLPVEVEYASEFRYRKPIIEEGTVVLAISQSGETADTLGALWEAKQQEAMVLAICNVVGSTLAREADSVLYLRAGPEIGVASTKAFTAQVAVLALLALALARERGVSPEEGEYIASHLALLPDHIQAVLRQDEHIRHISTRYAHCDNFLYLGRSLNFPVALEGALKLKEVSYIHAEGYPAAEMKHGPIALIDPQMPVVVVATRDDLYDKVINGIEEIRARKGQVIAIATEGDAELQHLVDEVIYIPQVPSVLEPLLTVIPLQLLAYHIAVQRNCDVDKPRNLAKSVTVE